MTNDFHTAQYEKMIELAQHALKTLVLINGGAAVALLAFIGSIWTPHDIAPLTIIFLAIGLGAFSLGVLYGAIASHSAFSTAAYGQSNDNALSKLYAHHTHKAVRISLSLFLIGIGASITAILIHFL